MSKQGIYDLRLSDDELLKAAEPWCGSELLSTCSATVEDTNSFRWATPDLYRHWSAIRAAKHAELAKQAAEAAAA